MVKGEFTINEISLLKVALEDMVSHGGDILMMERCINLYWKLEEYFEKLVEENTINE